MRIKQTAWLVCLVVVANAALLLAQRGESRRADFKVASGSVLELAVDSSDITIEVGGSGSVDITAEGLVDPDQNLQMFQDGNRVRVEYRSNGRWRSHRGGRFTVRVPADMDVDVSTSGGDIEINGDLQGRLIGHTSGGDVKLGDVSGDAELKTSGGDITAGTLQGRAELKTSGGDISVRQAAQDLDVHTSGGDIEIGDVGGLLVAKTSGGDVHAGNVAGSAELKTAGGDIELGRVGGAAELKTAGGDIEMQEAFGRVVAGTAGGDVVLHHITGSVEAKTAGGDIEVGLEPEGGQGSELKTAGGDIVLRLPPSAQVTIEAEIKAERGGSWRFRRNREEYDITSDFEAASYQRDPETGAVYAVYQVNGGGPLIKMETNEGNIQIRSGGGKLLR